LLSCQIAEVSVSKLLLEIIMARLEQVYDELFVPWILIHWWPRPSWCRDEFYGEFYGGMRWKQRTWANMDLSSFVIFPYMYTGVGFCYARRGSRLLMWDWMYFGIRIWEISHNRYAHHNSFDESLLLLCPWT